MENIHFFKQKDGKVLSYGRNNERKLIIDGANECQVLTETKIKFKATCFIADYDCSIVVIAGKISQNLW